jgi:hypothetical protein
MQKEKSKMIMAMATVGKKHGQLSLLTMLIPEE